MFDTQIAHRKLAEASSKEDCKNTFSQNNVGLNELLKRYLNEANECKDSIQSEMKSNQYFWDKRPLTEEMLQYAAQDVIFLPKLYQSFCNDVEKLSQERRAAGKRVNFEISEVFSEAMKCNDYAEINNTIQSLQSNDRIQAFIKNIQEFGIYCSLNLGITGFISHK